MSKLASIQKIHSIQKHPNPEVEKLEIGMVMSWPVVIPKGQFKDGDMVVFIEIDSIVPKENPYFSFMEKMKYRVWNAKFKGAPSSGLVCPLSILPSFRVVGGPSDEVGEGYYLVSEGLDVTDELNIKKYERPMDFTACEDAQGNFPTNFISITDEENLLSNSKALIELEDKEIYISQKVDGSSTTFIYNNGDFKACSRRLEMKEGSGFPWGLEKKYDIKNKLSSLGKNLAIQSEALGPKLNGNSLELKELEMKIFRMKNLDTKQILGLTDLQFWCGTLNLPMIDIIEVCNFDKNRHTVEYFRQLADKQIWKTNGKPGEGIVIAPTIPFYSPILQKSWSLKVINQNYK